MVKQHAEAKLHGFLVMKSLYASMFVLKSASGIDTTNQL